MPLMFRGCLCFSSSQMVFLNEAKLLFYMENRLILNIQILPKFIVETGGSDYSIFAFFKTRYVYCKIGKNYFLNKKHTLPPYKLNGRSLCKNYVNSNIVFSLKRYKSSSYIYKFQLIDKCWSLFKSLCTNKPGKKCLDSCISNSGTEPDCKKARRR